MSDQTAKTPPHTPARLRNSGPVAWAVQCQSGKCGMSPLTYGPRPPAHPCPECGADTQVVDLYTIPPEHTEADDE